MRFGKPHIGKKALLDDSGGPFLPQMCETKFDHDKMGTLCSTGQWHAIGQFQLLESGSARSGNRKTTGRGNLLPGRPRSSRVQAHGQRTPHDLHVTAVIASAGRADVIAEVLQDLQIQSHPLTAIVVSVPDERSLPVGGLAPGVLVVTGTRGAAAQRNAGLRAAPETDIAFFFDDDTRVRFDYVEHALGAFEAHPSVIALSGRVLLDGAAGDEIPVEGAMAALSDSVSISTDGVVEARKTLYGCNFAYRRDRTTQMFDERLPLYSWLEDHDLARRLSKEGRLITAMDCVVVHRGVKSGGRQSHLRFGYSQVMNPAYFVQKRSFPVTLALDEVGRRVIKNLLSSLSRKEGAWRRERLRGNALAAVDVLRGRVTPERILHL